MTPTNGSTSNVMIRGTSAGEIAHQAHSVPIQASFTARFLARYQPIITTMLATAISLMIMTIQTSQIIMYSVNSIGKRSTV